jgi:kinesin family member 5
MFGPDIGEEEKMGIIPRACRHIFQYISRCSDGTEFTIKCSFLEIYKEIIKDLLNPKNSNLKIRESPQRGVWVEGLTELFVTCEQDVLDLLRMGERFRKVASTKMNATSSRSHSLFILQLTQKSPDGSTKTGKLNLADLAGSEKISKTGATGETLEEAKKINLSLSALGNCINALSTRSKHIPYRDSTLTFILRESLGGNSKTTLLIACSPHVVRICQYCFHRHIAPSNNLPRL